MCVRIVGKTIAANLAKTRFYVDICNRKCSISYLYFLYIQACITFIYLVCRRGVCRNGVRNNSSRPWPQDDQHWFPHNAQSTIGPQITFTILYKSQQCRNQKQNIAQIIITMLHKSWLKCCKDHNIAHITNWVRWLEQWTWSAFGPLSTDCKWQAGWCMVHI